MSRATASLRFRARRRAAPEVLDSLLSPFSADGASCGASLTGLSAGGGVLGSDGFFAGGGVLGSDGLFAGGGVLGSDGLFAGGGVLGSDGFFTGGGVLSLAVASGRSTALALDEPPLALLRPPRPRPPRRRLEGPWSPVDLDVPPFLSPVVLGGTTSVLGSVDSALGGGTDSFFGSSGTSS